MTGGRNASSSAVQNRNTLCPRLIDYLVIVGRRYPARSTSMSAEQHEDCNKPMIHNPELLRRYPVDDHKDFILPTDVTYFCQPEGCTTYGGRKTATTIRDTSSFVFTLTEKDSGKIRHARALSRSLTSLCLISHHPFFTTFRESMTILRRLVDACNVRVAQIKKCGGSKVPKDAVWSALTGQWSDNVPAIIMHEIREIETWIFKLLSAPVPVPSKTRVQLTVLPENLYSPLQFAIPDNTRLSLIDLPIHLPIELLGVENTVKVLCCIMLEYKVLVQSRDFNAVSMSVLALVALLYPLEYMFPVIPLLPAYMTSAEQILLAPTPYVIGVPESFAQSRHVVHLPPDVVLVDLDANKILLPDNQQLPDLPEPEQTQLHNNLRHALNGIHSIQDQPDTNAVDVAARIAMIRFFDSPNVLGNFSEHTRTLRLYPRPVVALQVDSFLRARPIRTDFIIQLSRTMAIEYFAESALNPKNEAYLRIQNGIIDLQTIGDKQEYFMHTLQPVNFSVLQDNSTLGSAWQEYVSSRKQSIQMTDESGESGSNDNLSSGSSLSSINDLVFENPNEFDPLNDAPTIRPLGDVDNMYQEPLALELPECESNQSVADSSSGRSSPSSVNNTNLDSEADFARMAENMALSPRNVTLADDKSFESQDTITSPPSSEAGRRTVIGHRISNEASSSQSTPTYKKAFTLPNTNPNNPENITTPSSDTGSIFTGFMNGYAGRTERLMKSVATANAALRDRTEPMRTSLAERMQPGTERLHTAQAGLLKHMVREPPRDSAEKAALQGKNQLAVKEICDAVLAGNGVGLLSIPRLKRLMEDESLRNLACTRLNIGLQQNYGSEDEELNEVHITRAQYKGYVRVLHACVQGIDAQYYAPGATGLASTLQVMEIAHTHYWAKEVDLRTPNSVFSGLLGTPSASSQDLSKISPSSSHAKLPRSSSKSSMRDLALPQTDTPPVSPRPDRPRPPTFDSIRQNSKCGFDELPSAQRPSFHVGSDGHDDTPNRHTPSSVPNSLELDPAGPPPNLLKTYIHEELLVPQPGNLWTRMQFWEDVFYDAVAVERDIVGMDQDPVEMMDRYSALPDADRKRLEQEEDRLLATLLHNMTAFMVMCGAPLKSIQQKIRRLLGKSRVGLIHSQHINLLLDSVGEQKGNDIPLKPIGSRLMQKQTFSVHVGTNSSGDMMFMEVCDDAIIVRGVNGAMMDRWWYERLVNMTYSPRTKVLCLWRRNADAESLHLDKFYTKKCRDLYTCIKSAMERAALRGNGATPGKDLGGEFPVEDLATGQGGILHVRIDGIALIFHESKYFIELGDIKKCTTHGGNVFVLEEYDRVTRQENTRRFASQMADQICYAVLCVFSYVAAQNQRMNTTS